MADAVNWLKKRAKGVVAQVNPFDSGATYSTTVHAPAPKPATGVAPMPSLKPKPATSSLGDRLNKAGTGVLAPMHNPAYRDRSFGGSVRRAASIYGGGLKRSAIGLGQATSGSYDLVTPGTGTNRLSKSLHTAAQQEDERIRSIAPDNPFTTPLYKTGQFAGDVAQFGATGKLVKAAGAAATKVPGATRTAQVTTKLVRPLTNTNNRAIASVARKGAGGRIVATGMRAATNPANIANMGVTTGLDLGAESGKGRDISRGDVALAVGASAGLGVGLPVVGKALQEGARAATPAVRKGVQQGMQAAKTAKRAHDIATTPRIMNLHPNERYVLSDFADYQMGQYKPENAAVTNQLFREARTAARKAGVDLTGPPARVRDNIAQFLEIYDSAASKARQGGYARIPSGKNDPAPDLNQPQKVFVNDYAEMLEGMDKTSGGAQLVKRGDDYSRITANSPFYREKFSEKGRAPTKAEYFDEARRQLEDGQAMHGAHDDYAKLTREANDPDIQSLDSRAELPVSEGELLKRNADALRREALDYQSSLTPARPSASKTKEPTIAEISQRGNARPEAEIQSAIERAHNAGDDKAVAELITHLPPDMQRPMRSALGIPDAAPTPDRPQINRMVEESTGTQQAVRNVDLDREILADLGRAGSTTRGIIEAHAERAGIPVRQATDDVWRVASEGGYDIRDGYPVRASAADNTPLAALRSGADTEAADIAALNKATQTLRSNAAKGLTGVKHAVVLKESPYQRQNLYIDKNGDMQVFVTQKRPDGSWQEIVNSHAPIRSTQDGPGVFRLMSDPDVQREVARASEDGMTRQYIWTELDNGATDLKTRGRKDPVTPQTMAFDPNKHVVEGGFVRDKQSGEILGNYVAVGPSGIEVQIGRHFTTLDIDPSKLHDRRSGNNSFNQAERWVEAVTDDERTREQLRNLIIHPTREAEARLKAEANALGTGIASWRKALNATVPAGDRKAMLRDAVYVLEPDSKQVRQLGRTGAKADIMKAFTDAHGERAAQVLGEYEQWMRAAYDNLLERMNTVRRQFGMDEVPRRDDYITHIQELNSGISQIYQALSEGIFGEVDGVAARGKLPAQIAGATESFKPVTKYNPFAKKRTGDYKPQDPFSPLITYGGVTLHNIHLTRPAAMVRSLETALRAAKEFADNVPGKLDENDPLAVLGKKYGGNYSDMIEWLTEHANILSGKSSSLNRWFLKSSGGRSTMRAMNFMQRWAGRTNILGNASSVLAQSLSLPNTLGTNGIEATAKGFGRSLADAKANAAWRKSDFMKERYIDGSVLRNNTALEKVLKPFGVPLKLVERAFVHIAWNASYERVLAQGLSGDAAIKAANSRTSKIVAGRSIGDTAHVYQSTAGSAALQFTREVTEAWKNFVKDQTPYGKALTLVTAFGMNWAFEQATGRSPLPDPIGAVVDTIRDARSDDHEDESLPAQAGRALQRGAATVVGGVPLAGAVANQLPQDARRTLFGSESDLGRYDGALALLGPGLRLKQAIEDLVGGDFEAAGQNAAGVLPAGGQIRKTWQGLDTMQQGAAENGEGKHQTDVGDNTLNWVRAALFGKNALPEVQAYYSGGNKVAFPGDFGAALKEYERSNGGLKKRYREAFGDADFELLGMNTDERQALIDAGALTPEKVAGLTRYGLNKRRELGMPAGNDGQPVPKGADGLDDDFQAFYKDRSYVYDDDYEAWRTQPAKGSAAGLMQRAQGIAAGRDPLPQTNEVAEMYADFAARRARDKWGGTKENSEKLKFLSAAYKTQLSPQQREWYALSDDNLQSAIETGELSAGELDELVGFDDRLREFGLKGEIGNGLRKDYGYREWRKSASGSGGRRRRKDVPDLPSSYFDTASTLEAFSKLLSGARL